jgi:hypothetical protein
VADLGQISSSDIHRATAWPTHNDKLADKTPVSGEGESLDHQAGQAQQPHLHRTLEDNQKDKLRFNDGLVLGLGTYGAWVETGSKAFIAIGFLWSSCQCWNLR